ncbi:DNA mismatch repair protein PMS1 (Postmeiotic segregation protein 1) (Protein POSTMEIOTIC SEGREGATION 1) [Durusdinium trenchii]|uniref:DNA mismatch repair protein PMS1 (Postmeiotic segregation protein 1) (Protein POSTMEIOTIC SEGREGATION 1) n=1 Tax=Durusdinium trenchii TaxID=1381693 RepID=A0ABP0ME02_9DINO
MPPFRLGLIADIQYADCEDGTDFSGSERRYFRNSLKITERAVDCWNANALVKTIAILTDLQVVQLGDIIDGCNSKLQASETALKRVLEVLSRSPAPRFDLVGNHELYNLPRDALERCGLRCGEGRRSYYAAHLGDFWEGIFLDPFEVALIGVPQDSPQFVEATETIRTHNPQVLTGARDWFTGLPTEKHRFVPYNGGISQTQLKWLESKTSLFEADSRKVLIFLHVPLYEPATKAKTVVWNAEEILHILHTHRDTVVAVFAGHDHDGGYAVDEAGLHHITMNSPLTAEGDCFAVLECYEGWAHFKAHGHAVNSTSPLSASSEDSSVLQAMGFDSVKAQEALQALRDFATGNLDAAACVKELVENSLDAKATRIEVRLRDSGAELLEAVQKGSGDFSTFGFRGEALSAISAMGDLTIATKTKASAASLLCYDRYGKLASTSPIAREVGTTVSVRELFKRLPVRHKEFMRNAKSQVSATLRLIQSYAIAQPQVRFSVIAEKLRGPSAGKATLLCTSGTASDWHQAAAAVLGDAALSKTQKLNISAGPWQVEGLISSPVAGRRSRDAQLFFVNGRPIDAPKRVAKLINDTYHQYNSRAWPLVILSFTAPQGMVDVNVTPDKKQVFLHEEETPGE